MIYLRASFAKQPTGTDLGIFYRIVRVTGIADISEDDEYHMSYDDYINQVNHYEFRTAEEKAIQAKGLFATLLNNINCSINDNPSRGFVKWCEKKHHEKGDERNAI